MPKRQDVKRVLLLGSGPIVIGQAAEFDYAGSQACLSLKEEGIQIVLVNSNPATIMTDPTMADRVYIEPLTLDIVEQVICKEKPDSLLPTLGGQVGLNLAKELHESGVLQRHGVRLLGTPIDAIRQAEDRQMFKDMLRSIDQPVPESVVVTNADDALRFATRHGYPVVVRPAYTLGGTGGGIAYTESELAEIVRRALKMSIIGQALIEKCVSGWKEIEYEVMRDSIGNCITVCNMENLDPMGIHTGDSVVVAPSQTISQDEYQMLRSASLKIISALGIEGGCNVQFALDPESSKYYVIEVNPRVSRSSALASKATGYPIARIAAKIAIGLNLDEITNPITQAGCACFEPALDYVVVKIPRWPFDKFSLGDRRLGTQMKATGEVMAIGRSFESALHKAVCCLEADNKGFYLPGLKERSVQQLLEQVACADDERLFVVAELLRRGVDTKQIRSVSCIDPWFLSRIKSIVLMEQQIAAARPDTGQPLADAQLEAVKRAKRMGFPDSSIASIWGVSEAQVRLLRKHKAHTSYRMVDTCAGEFSALTPYYYSVFGEADEAQQSAGSVIVVGSGPIRIGQGIEFDYSCVRAVQAFRKQGIRTVVINNNPETVSTDFSISDRLYFEPLAVEDVLEVVRKEAPLGIVLQFGGQTAINLARYLHEEGIPVLGTSPDTIDMAEDRQRFEELLAELGISRPAGGTAHSVERACEIACNVGYPVLVRPSYVLGGRAMQVVYNEAALKEYMLSAIKVSPEHPVLIDQYISGVEIEIDAVADGEDTLIPAIMEHVERAGVHSGDSIAFCPSKTLDSDIESEVVSYVSRIAKALSVRGLLNAQFVVRDKKVYVLEVNPRASRTVPFVSKVTGVPLVDIAVAVMCGNTLRSLGYTPGLMPRPTVTGVKVPVFSWAKLTLVDTSLGPEMKSTGEVMGVDTDPNTALYKALLAAGISLDRRGSVLLTVADRDKHECVSIARMLIEARYALVATPGTCAYLREHGLDVQQVPKLDKGDHIVERIVSGEITLVVNTLTGGERPRTDGFRIRRVAVEHGIPCLTSLDTAHALCSVLCSGTSPESVKVLALQDLHLAEGRGHDVAQSCSGGAGHLAGR